jgi:3-dehydroquinate synthetase
VQTPGGAYPAYAGWGILDRLSDWLRERGLTRTLHVIADAVVADLHGERLLGALRAGGIEPVMHALPLSESRKTLAAAEEIYDRLVARRAERSHAVLAFGGGVATDLGGFVAATYLRGLPLVQAPTSLLSMVDAAIGGKVAVNHREGKNLTDRRLGRGDQARADHGPRTARLAGERDGGAARAGAGTVGADAATQHRDQGGGGQRRRARVRPAHDAQLRPHHRPLLHGEAVAVGMVAAAHIARALGLLSAADEERQNRLIARFGLPLRAPGMDVEAVLAAMSLDKKVSGKNLRWVLLDGLGRTVIRDDVPLSLVREAVERVVAGEPAR